jgi:hypothetical protein
MKAITALVKNRTVRIAVMGTVTLTAALTTALRGPQLFMACSIWAKATYGNYQLNRARRSYNQSSLNGQFLVPGKLIVGMNYPWLNYGGDFGTNGWGHGGISVPKQHDRLESDFADLESHGIHVIRWWLFADGHSGIVVNPKAVTSAGNHPVAGLDPYFFPDMDAALDVAREHHIMIMFTFFDFSIVQDAVMINGVQTKGRRDWVTDPEVRKSLMDNVFKPIFQRYGHNGAIVAYDVINEPEWVMGSNPFLNPGCFDDYVYMSADEFRRAVGAGFNKPVRISVMQEFVREITTLAHQYTKQVVTVGSARRDWMDLWTNVGLDFYQFHHYPYMQKKLPVDYPAQALGLSKPVVFGEFPTAGLPQHTKGYPTNVIGFFDIGLKDHYAGVAPWGYNSQDPSTDMRGHWPEFDAWMEAHKDVIAFYRKLDPPKEKPSVPANDAAARPQLDGTAESAKPTGTPSLNIGPQVVITPAPASSTEQASNPTLAGAEQPIVTPAPASSTEQALNPALAGADKPIVASVPEKALAKLHKAKKAKAKHKS